MDTEKTRILVVDDEQIVLRSLSEWFREDGYIVGTASTGKEALVKLTEEAWDIFLLDIKMPGMSGLELQKKIKEIDPDSIIIIMTAFASVDSAVQALKQGAYDYLTKLFDPEHVGHLIRNAVERKSLAAENVRLKKSIEESVLVHDIIGADELLEHDRGSTKLIIAAYLKELDTAEIFRTVSSSSVALKP